MAEYKLSYHHWRSLSTFVLPLIVIAFYAFICRAFLLQPPVNDVVETTYGGGRWIFFVWFVMIVFILDWSRVGLANIEAAALMHPRLAPTTAESLMWHTDNKWANPVWWSRAVIGGFRLYVWPRRRDVPTPSVPNRTWVLFALTTLFIYCTLPLSGLTMEQNDVLTLTNTTAPIYGPSLDTYNWRSSLAIQQRLRTYWQSGRPTSPTQETILYAPDGTSDVSTTYFDDLIRNGTDTVEFFAGPAVRQRVSGQTWGLKSKISCNTVPKEQLQLLRIRNFDFAVQECISIPHRDWEFNCSQSAYRSAKVNQVAVKKNSNDSLPFPFWVSGAGTSGGNTTYMYVTAADGFPGIDIGWSFSPLSFNTSHDNLTWDSVVNRRSPGEPTTGLFEIYLWQYIKWDDGILPALNNGTIQESVDIVPSAEVGGNFTGFAVQCKIETAGGIARLDAGSRTFSAFRRLAAKTIVVMNIIFIGTRQYAGLGYISDMSMPQILAATALINGNQSLSDAGRVVADVTTSTDSIWVALHAAIGIAPSAISYYPNFNSPGPSWARYRGLRPSELRLAMYKLLGETIIALMDEGGTDVWQGQLFTLKPATYLVRSFLHWSCILTLLCVWALVLCGGSLWLAIFAGPRWAPTLDGVEMFKFGARYTDQVNEFMPGSFQKSSAVLRQVPGMVGMLPGTNDKDSTLGFIGLSENTASKETTYTMNRTEAAKTRR